MTGEEQRPRGRKLWAVLRIIVGVPVIVGLGYAKICGDPGTQVMAVLYFAAAACLLFLLTPFGIGTRWYKRRRGNREARCDETDSSRPKVGSEDQDQGHPE